MYDRGKNRGKERQNQRGFTLIELAVSLMVLSLVVAAALSTEGPSRQIEEKEQLSDMSAQIYDMMRAYYCTQDYGKRVLPCPADGEISADDPDFGVVVKEESCNRRNFPLPNVDNPPAISVGVVPTRRLRIPSNLALDVWKNKFTYVVADSMTSPGGDSSPITIVDEHGNMLDDNVAYLIISHGPNGYGSFGFRPSKNQQDKRISPEAISVQATNGLEIENHHLDNPSEYNATFVRPQSPQEGFDDIVYYLTIEKLKTLCDNYQGYLPSDRDGLALWIDGADREIMQLNDNNKLTRLLDKHSKEPINIHGDPILQAGGLNGKSVLQLDGGGDYFSITNNNLKDLDTHSVFVLVNHDNASNNTNPGIFYNGNPDSGVSIFYQAMAGQCNERSGMIHRLGSPQTCNDNEHNVFAAASNVFDLYGFVYDGTKSTIYKNGKKLGTKNLEGPPDAAGSVAMLFGGAKTGSYWQGKVAEVVVYRDAISEADQCELHGYLRYKWGLTLPPCEGEEDETLEIPYSDQLSLWLDAAERDTLTLNNSGFVELWQDRSGKGHHVGQSLAQHMPYYKPASINGLPAVQFDGLSDANDFLRGANISLQALTDGENMTAFAVQRLPENTQQSKGSLFDWYGTVSSGKLRMSLYAPWDSGVYFNYGLCEPNCLDGEQRVSSAAPHDLYQRTVLVSARRDSEGQAYIFMNGSKIAEGLMATNLLSHLDQTGNLIVGSGINAAPGDTMPGEIAELAIYKQAMSESQRCTVETYLAQKWGISNYQCQHVIVGGSGGATSGSGSSGGGSSSGEIGGSSGAFGSSSGIEYSGCIIGECDPSGEGVNYCNGDMCKSCSTVTVSGRIYYGGGYMEAMSACGEAYQYDTQGCYYCSDQSGNDLGGEGPGGTSTGGGNECSANSQCDEYGYGEKFCDNGTCKACTSLNPHPTRDYQSAYWDTEGNCYEAMMEGMETYDSATGCYYCPLIPPGASSGDTSASGGQ